MKRRKTPYPPFTHNYCDRHGKRHSDYRRGKTVVPLPHPHLGTDYFAAYRAACAAYVDGTTSTIGARRTVAGSFKAGCIAYFAQSLQFNNKLAPSTQRQWRAVLERLCVDHGDKPLRLLKRAHIEGIVTAKAATHPGAAHLMLKILRQVCKFWLANEMIDRDPTQGIDNVELAGDGWVPWSEAEEAQYQAYYPIGTRERLCLEFLRWWGLRISDVAAIGPQHIATGELVLKQEKTEEPIRLPIAAELREIIAATPAPVVFLPDRRSFFLTTRNGKPFSSAAALSQAFIRWCKAAGLPPHRSAHGIRKAFATAIVDAGGNSFQGSAALGHTGPGLIDHYAKRRDRAAAASAGITLLEAHRANKIGEPKVGLAKSGS